MATATPVRRKKSTPPPAEETNRRGELLRAAARLFREKGYAATTIRDIAGAVGMRSGSPFYHFKTKHDMLRAVVLEGIAAIHDVVAAAAAGEQDPRARFEAMVRAHVSLMLGDGRDIAAALLHELRHLEPVEQAEVVALRDNYEAMWRAVLKDLKREGLVADDSPLARFFLLGAMNWTTQWYREEGRFTPTQIAKALSNFVLQSK